AVQPGNGRRAAAQKLPVGLEQNVRIAAVPPVFDGERQQLLPLLDHALQAVGQLVLPFDLDVLGDDVAQAPKQQIAVPHIVNADDGQIRGRLLGLFHQPPDPLPVQLHHAELARIGHPAYADGAFSQTEGLFEIGLENRIAQYDQGGFTIRERVLRHVDGVAQTFALGLLHRGDLERRVVSLYVRDDAFAPLPDDEHHFVHPDGCQPVEDVAENGFARYV